MNQYKVFKHPAGSIEAVKIGLSWPALFFGSFWAMVKKMWWLGVGTLIGILALKFIISTVGGVPGVNGLNSIITSMANIIFCINGNSWREENLVSRGFEHVTTVTAANPAGAKAMYLKGSNAER